MWPVLLTVLSVACLLVADFRRWPTGIWLCKPLASTGFILCALSRGATSSTYGKTILAALVFSWLGDVLLIPRGALFFQLGLGSFLLAHLCFCTAFLVLGVSFPWALLATPLLLLLLLPVTRWLLPRVPGDMRLPVLTYMGVISLMVVLSAGTAAATGKHVVLLAALMFYLSDLSVARDQFVAPGFGNRLWGLPLYYLAQLLFAMSVAP